MLQFVAEEGKRGILSEDETEEQLIEENPKTVPAIGNNNKGDSWPLRPSPASTLMLIRHILLPLLLGLIIYPLVDHGPSHEWHFEKKEGIEDVIVSSGVCSGSDRSNRRCRFNNLFLEPIYNDFVFVYDPERSVRNGISFNRMAGLVDTSSVSNHTAYSFNFVDVSSEFYDEFIGGQRNDLTLSPDRTSSKFNNHDGLKKRIVDDNSENSVHRNIFTIKGRTLFLGRFKPDNLMHLIHDDILPLLATIQELSIDYSIENILFLDDWNQHDKDDPFKFMWEIYQKVFPRFKLFHIQDLISESKKSNSVIKFDHAHIGLVKDTVWYDYGFFQPPHPLSRSKESDVITRKVINQMSQRLIGGEKGTCKGTSILIISRKETRIIVNEEELIRSLVEKGHQVDLIDLSSEKSISDVIKKVNCGKVLIGVHGAGLVLTAFMPRSSALIEIFPFGVPSHKYSVYRTLSSIVGVNYFNWSNHDRSKSIGHPDYPPQVGGILHLPKNEQSKIVESDTINDHLCCSDSNWLYKINQDTVVDIDTVMDIVSRITSQVSKSDMDVDISDSMLLPGNVQGVECTQNQGSRSIKWEAPWNAKMIGSSKVEYQVTIRSRKDGRIIKRIKTDSAEFELHSRNKVKINFKHHGESGQVRC